ncbi:MAG: hypothetical protein Mars2KO_33680 [Maribacter sp.]|uniref:GNAT family N-acetyltransferase n=1 Tax=Maribacter sp. 2307UL18-2 TaxID=3386274 RepID=UPI0039BD785B
MKHIVHFEPLHPKTFQDYIEVGTRAYNQHYLHLWPLQDSSPYISNSFTLEILEKEERDENTLLYLIKSDSKVVGVLKFTLNARLDGYTQQDALYVDKIYIQREYSGKGIGGKTIQFVLLRAAELQKKIVWLDAMQKGPALNFYLKNGFDIYGESEIRLPTVLETEKQMYIMVKELRH